MRHGRTGARGRPRAWRQLQAQKRAEREAEEDEEEGSGSYLFGAAHGRHDPDWRQRSLRARGGAGLEASVIEDVLDWNVDRWHVEARRAGEDFRLTDAALRARL